MSNTDDYLKELQDFDSAQGKSLFNTELTSTAEIALLVATHYPSIR